VTIVGKEGIKVHSRDRDGTWQEGSQQPSLSPAGEIRESGSSGPLHFLATVEPMHGNQLAVHVRFQHNRTLEGDGGSFDYHSQTLTDRLVEGHALQVGDLLGAGGDQIVVGWRGKAGTTDTSIGVALWTPLDQAGEKWRETVIDADGMACEDLQLADLNGSGRLDIIASGRRTHNLKIYFNETVLPRH
jgi:hypothetical protein